MRATLLTSLRIGTLTIGVQATAERPGEKRFASQATCRAIVISVRKASAFLSVTISDSRSTTTGIRTWCGARGRTINHRDRSGTPADDRSVFLIHLSFLIPFVIL